MKKLLLMMVTAVLLCSCGGLTNISTPNSVALNQGNFKFVKTVSAETKATYVFAIGGLSPRATTDVVEKLKFAAQLQPNQALADIRIKKTLKLFAFGIVATRKLTATASVVEFLDVETYESSNNSPLTGQKVNSNTSYSRVVGSDSNETADNPAIEFTPTVAEKDTREVIYERLREIISILQKGTADNVETILKEINDIEMWYKTHGYNTLDENKGMKTAKKLLQSK